MYVARRYFRLTPVEWDGTPWWVQRAYLEGLVEDGVGEMTESAAPASSAANEPGARSTSVKSLDPFADLSEFAAFGVTTKG